jgi:hypothetical protein
VNAGNARCTGDAVTAEQALAGVPSPSEHTPPTGQGGPQDSFSQPAPTVSAGQRRERTVHASASLTAKTVLTANPNRTKAPTRQEVNR